MTDITQHDNRWEVAGIIHMDSANTFLKKSKALELAENAVIDFSNVTDVDTSAVSLMLEWHRRAIEENKQLTFVNLPAGLSSLTVLYGVTDLIS